MEAPGNRLLFLDGGASLSRGQLGLICARPTNPSASVNIFRFKTSMSNASF